MEKVEQSSKKYKKNYLELQDLRDLLRDNKIKTQLSYQEFRKSNKGIPSAPGIVYRNKGWIGWGDLFDDPFYNRKVISNGLYMGMSYEQAKNLVFRLGIKSGPQYYKYLQENKGSGLPSTPRKVFLNHGWAGWGEFLGTGSVKRWATKSTVILFDKKMTYNQAKEIMSTQGLTTNVEFVEWFKTNKNFGVPSEPARVFRGKGWVSWIDFLGAELIRVDNTNISIEDFILEMDNLEIKTMNGYILYRLMNPRLGLPGAVESYCCKYGLNFREILNNSKKHEPREMAPHRLPRMSKNRTKEFLVMRELLANIELQGKRDYLAYRLIQKQYWLPSDPLAHFKKLWVSWEHFLGKKPCVPGRYHRKCHKPKKFKPFREKLAA